MLQGNNGLEAQLQVTPDRLDRNFDLVGPNQAWSSDITYLWADELAMLVHGTGAVLALGDWLANSAVMTGRIFSGRIGRSPA